MILINIIVLLSFADIIRSLQTPSATSTCGEIFVKQTKAFNVFTSKTYNGEFPWHVAVYRREKYGSRTFICSGVLINWNTIVTTAHCLYGDYGVISPDSLIVSLGKYDIDVSTLNTEELHVSQTIINEKFDRFNLEHDIALIKMASNATYTNFIQPICLASQTISDEMNSGGVVVGWGHNKFSANGNLLTKGEIVLQTSDECRHNHKNIFQSLLYGNRMCGKYMNDTELCSGDSGSGLFYEQNGRWYLRGIFSLGIALTHQMHCDSAQLLIFTEMVNYFDWIAEKMLIK